MAKNVVRIFTTNTTLSVSFLKKPVKAISIEALGQTGSIAMAQETDVGSSRIDREAFRIAAVDSKLGEVRKQLARLTSTTFAATGELLQGGGHLLGSDRAEGRSSSGHGSDETVAVSLLTRYPLLSATRSAIPKHFQVSHPKNLLSTHSLFHSNRLRSFIISIAFALVPYCETGCHSSPEPQLIRECFAQYKQAILDRNGEEAVHRVDSSTLRYYASMKDAALNAKEEDVRNMTITDKINVLGFRHQIGIAQLQHLSEQELLVFLVDQGMTGREGVTDSELGQTSISGNTAQGEILSRGQNTGFKFRFVKDDGKWRLDLTAILPMVDQGMKTVISRLGVNEDQFILNMLERMSFKPVPRGIWEPLVKK